MEDADLATTLAAKNHALDEAVGRVNALLQPVLERPLEEQLAKLDLYDRAKLEVLLAFALNSLLFVYLRTEGANTKEHPVKQGLERVKEYFAKVQESGASHKPTLRLNQAAAKRFVTHGLIANEEVSREVKKRKQLDDEAETLLQQLIPTVPQPPSGATSAGSTPQKEGGSGGGPSTKKKKKNKKTTE
ncbi:hypothetical protein HDU86_002767 [Geranomyces michiganensis]|nr:hypothetical protein HDU86_002767 [Geranomyces michiganensis]